MGNSWVPVIALLVVIGVQYLNARVVLGPSGNAKQAVAVFTGPAVTGKLLFEQHARGAPVLIRGVLYGLPTGMHGMHIHSNPGIDSSCISVGEHFNPMRQQHGSPSDPVHHAGDLGNIRIPSFAGKAVVSVTTRDITLFDESDPRNILGLPIVVHQLPDDLGRGKNLESLRSGNAGDHLGCGQILLQDNVDLSQFEEEPMMSGMMAGKQLPGAQNAYPFSYGQKVGSPRLGSQNVNPILAGSTKYPSSSSQIPQWGGSLMQSNWPYGKASHDVKRAISGESNMEAEDYYTSISASSTGNVWKVGNIYEYEYQGWMSSGVPSIAPQFAGASIKFRLTIEPKNENNLVVSFVDARAKTFNENIMDKLETMQNVESDPGKNVNVEDREYLEKPFIVSMSEGKVDSMTLGADEPLWVVNFKRGILSQLQLQLDQNSALFEDKSGSPEDNFGSENSVYVVMEECTTGRCETWYEITRLTDEVINAQPEMLPYPELCQGKSAYQVKKVRDLDKCPIKPKFNLQGPNGLQCSPELSSCQNMYSHSDNAGIVGCTSEDGSFLVQRVITVDKLVMKPFAYETEPVVGSSVQRIQLRNVKKSSASGTRMPTFRGQERTIKTLVFSFDEDLIEYGPRMKQPSITETNSPWVVDPNTENINKETRRLLQEVVRDLEGDDYYLKPTQKNVIGKINMIRKAFMFLNHDELRPLFFNLLDTVKNSSGKRVLIDALVAAGTNPTLPILFELVNKGIITGELATARIAMLPMVVKIPTKQVFEGLIDFLTSDVVENDRQLKVTTALAVSRLFYQACVNETISAVRYPELAMGEMCNPNDDFYVNRLLPYLAKELNNADDLGEQTAMLAALENIGHESIIPILEPYINSCDPSLEDIEDSGRARRESAFEEEDEEEEEEEEEEEDFSTGSKSIRQKAKKNERKLKKQMRKEQKQAKASSKKNVKKGKKGGKDEEEEEEEDAWSLTKGIEEDVGGKKAGKKASKFGAQPSRFQEKTMKAQAWKKAQTKGKVKKGGKEEEEQYQSDAITPQKETTACTIMRSKAIYALSQLAIDQNVEVARILRPIAVNKADDPEVRIAAYTMLFLRNPRIVFWQKAALSTWFEPNFAVNSFLYSTITNMASLKHPLKRDIAQKAEAVLPLLKPRFTNSPHASIHYITGHYEERNRLGYLVEFINSLGTRSFTSSNMYGRMVWNWGPFRNPVLEFASNAKHLEKLIDLIMGDPAIREKAGFLKDIYGAGLDYEGLQPKSKAPINLGPITGSDAYKNVKASPELVRIQEELQIKERAAGDPEAILYINLLDNIQRFFYLDEDTIREAVRNVLSSRIMGTPQSGTNINFHKWVPLSDAFVRVPSAMGLAYAVYTHHKALFSVKGNVEGKFGLLEASEISGEIRPVVQMKLSTKICNEVPFTTVMPQGGVDLSWSMVLPGKFSVVYDYSEGQLSTSFEPIGDRVHLHHYSVSPFTGIKNINDFTPIVSHRETKVVALLDKPREKRNAYGEQVGFVLESIVRGDVQGIEDPFAYTSRVLGFNLYSWLPSTVKAHENVLVLDAAKSVTDEVRTTFSLEFKSKEGFDFSTKSGVKSSETGFANIEQQAGFKSAGPKSSSIGLEEDGALEEEEEFERGLSKTKAKFLQTIWSKQRGAWSSNKFRKLFAPMLNAYGISFDASVEFVGTTHTKRFGTSLTAGMGEYGKHQRVNVLLKQQQIPIGSEPTNYEICVEGEWKWPKINVVKSSEFLKADLTTYANLNIGFEGNCERNPNIALKAKFGRQSPYATAESKYVNEKCLEDEKRSYGVSFDCLTSRRLAATLDSYVLEFEYKGVPALIQNFTVKSANAFRHWMAPWMTDNQVGVRNPEGKIRIETDLLPYLGSMNMRVFKPKSNTFYENVRVHPMAQTIIPLNAEHVAPSLTVLHSPHGKCLVADDHVTTYDGLDYNITLTSCDHVVTKDCSGRYKMAVLAREGAGGKRIITLLLDNQKIEINPASNQVSINNQASQPITSGLRVPDDEGNVLAVIKKTDDGYVEVSAPQHWLHVNADEDELFVAGSIVHRGRLCGLCGSQNGETTDDLRGPQGCAIPSDLMDVAYMVENTGTVKSGRAASVGGTCSLPGGKYSGSLATDKENLKKIQTMCLSELQSTNAGQSYRPMTSTIGFSEIGGAAGCTTFRNQLSVRDGMRCFSISPVAKCRSGCRPANMIEKKFNFHCLPKGRLSEHLEKEVLKRPLDELFNKEAHHTMSLRVPTSCLQY